MENKKRRVKKLVLTRDEIITKFPTGMKIAEIGVLRGRYSKKILECKPSELHLIDCWKHVEGDDTYAKYDGCNVEDEKQEKKYQYVKEKLGVLPGVHIIREFSGPASKNFEDGSLDAVYIDGDHSYEGCLSDLRTYSKKIKSTGFMWGHDYTDCYRWIQVQEAIETFLAENPTWMLHCITSEVPKKSPSWFLVQEHSTVKSCLDEVDYLELDFAI